MDDFREGQIVELKSGGPKMTVRAVQGEVAVCVWFSGEKLDEGRFPLTSLNPAEIRKDFQFKDIIRSRPQ